MSKVASIMSDDGPPVFELFITLGTWNSPPGNLSAITLLTLKKYVRRTLDAIMNPELIAVGCFDAYPVVDDAGWKWRCAVRLLVTGTSRKELERRFERSRVSPVMLVTDVEKVATELFRFGIREWPHGGCQAIPVNKKHRGEYYAWLLGLKRDERIIRYGIDRHFRPLNKAPRTIRLKPRKRKPYPWHLVPHMFNRRPQPKRPRSDE